MIYALSVSGPTASGKTAVSIELAERIGAEIICCDSMQIYEKMDIGTAKATSAERARVPHHLLDFLPPGDPFSAEEYRNRAIPVAEDIQSRGKMPMFVGGTGLYIDTLMRARTDSVPESRREYRDKILESVRDEDAATVLWERLYAVDPESAETIHKNNVRRVIRALEIYDATGKPKSYFDKLSRTLSADMRIGMITLDFHNRDNLYSRVDLRVDSMMEEGLLAEVTRLYSAGYLGENTTARQAIGYKEIIDHIEGRCTLVEAVEQIKLSTRRYAKRQLTWFRHEENAYRLYIDGEDGKMRAACDIIDEAESAARKIKEGFKNEA